MHVGPGGILLALAPLEEGRHLECRVALVKDEAVVDLEHSDVGLEVDTDEGGFVEE